MATTTAVTRRHLRSAPAALFEALVDPERFARVRGVRRVTVLQDGVDGPRSDGAMRRIDLAPIGHMVEEFVALDAPWRFDYRITVLPLPATHHAGSIAFTPDRDGTLAEWRTTYAFDLPIGAGLAGRVSTTAVRRTFHTMLGEIDRACRS